jgi:preprotein translocase subunit YajC
MSAVNLSAGSETFLGVVLVLFLVVTGVFFYLFARDAREQQKRDNEKK